MKVHTTSPYQFQPNELLDQDRHATNTIYAVDAINDVTSKRYSHMPLVIQFSQNVAGGYSDSLNKEQRTFRFYCPNAIVVERAFFRYIGTGANVVINITDAGTGLPPPGVTNPILSIALGSTSLLQDASFVYPVTLNAGVQYAFEITAAGAFAASLAELELFLRSDRYLPAATDQSQAAPLVLLNETNTLDAATFKSTVDPVTAVAVHNFSSTYEPALRPLMVCAHGFTSAGPINLLRFDIPRVTNGQRREKIVGVFLAAVMATVGNAGQQVALSIQNQAGSPLASAAVSVSGVAQAQVFTAVSVDLGSGTPGIKSISADDYRLVLSTSDVASVFKGYAYIFIQ